MDPTKWLSSYLILKPGIIWSNNTCILGCIVKIIYVVYLYVALGFYFFNLLWINIMAMRVERKKKIVNTFIIYMFVILIVYRVCAVLCAIIFKL